jgi:hypothetical protein
MAWARCPPLTVVRLTYCLIIFNLLKRLWNYSENKGQSNATPYGYRRNERGIQVGKSGVSYGYSF